MLANLNRYRLVRVPDGSFPWHVVAPDGLPELRLTRFACELEMELSKGTIPVYLREVLLKPYPPERILAYPVSKAVNNPKNDQPELIASAEEA